MFTRSCGGSRSLSDGMGAFMVAFMVFASLIVGLVCALSSTDSRAASDPEASAAARGVLELRVVRPRGFTASVNPCPADEILNFMTSDGYFECVRGAIPITGFSLDLGDSVDARLEFEVLSPHTAGRLRCALGARPVVVGREITCVADCDSVLVKIAAELMR